jgi:dTDP-4-amino-4,6-dideoxygalactose transaminase
MSSPDRLQAPPGSQKGVQPLDVGRRRASRWDTTPIALTDLKAAHQPLRAELVDAFRRVLDSGHFVSGAEVSALEGKLAEFVGTSHAVAVGSGTAALTLALLGAGIGPGDEVILPANTFFATAEAVVAAGAVPVLADVDPVTASIDPRSVATVVTERTAAIIAVHLYGHPADVESLRAVAAGKSLLLLEDAAQAMGASRHGRPVGSLGDAAAFSFFPTKVLGGLGEGGAVSTNDGRLAERVRLLRSHGEDVKNVHRFMAFNERLDELQAALLLVKLSHLRRNLDERDQVLGHYQQLLREVPEVEMVTTGEGTRSVHHLMVVKVPERDRVLAQLHGSGIGAAVHYPTPIHLQPAWEHLGMGPCELPHAEYLARRVLSLPFYGQMSPEQVERCVTALAQAVSR